MKRINASESSCKTSAQWWSQTKILECPEIDNWASPNKDQVSGKGRENYKRVSIFV